MEDVIFVLLRGAGQGAIFALVALGFNLTYNSSGVLNFAQGQWVTLGGMVGFLFLTGNPTFAVWGLFLVVALVVIGAVVGVQGWLTLLPLRSSTDQHSWLVSTLAISVVLEAAILILQGPQLMRVPTPFGSMRLLGTPVPGPYVAAALSLAVWVVVLKVFHRSVLSGLAMRALAQDLDAAKAAGVRVRRLQVLSFAMSGAVAATAGYVAGPVLQISAVSGFFILLNGFIAAVLGGLGSNAGAVAGGLLLGIFSVSVSVYLSGQASALMSLLILTLVLMVRPRGLLGTPQMRRV